MITKYCDTCQENGEMTPATHYYESEAGRRYVCGEEPILKGLYADLCKPVETSNVIKDLALLHEYLTYLDDNADYDVPLMSGAEWLAVRPFIRHCPCGKGFIKASTNRCDYCSAFWVRKCLHTTIPSPVLVLRSPKARAKAAVVFAMGGEESEVELTLDQALAYRQYISDGLADTDGHFSPLSRSAWLKATYTPLRSLFVL